MSLFVADLAGPSVIGMVHLAPLPGTPLHRREGIRAIVENAVADALALQDGGAHGCLVQTVDRLYSPDDDADPARTAALTLVVKSVREATAEDFVVGVQMMRNAIRASLAIAKLCDCAFVRAGALVGATVTPSGIVKADPAGVMEYRRRIGAEDVLIVADVDTDQFRWLGGLETADVAHAARSVGADAVAVSDPDPNAVLRMIEAVRTREPGLPVVVAGHTAHATASVVTAAADAAYVGGCLKGDDGRVSSAAVRRYVALACP